MPTWAVILVIAAVFAMIGLIVSEIVLRRQIEKHLKEKDEPIEPRIRLPGE